MTLSKTQEIFFSGHGTLSSDTLVK